MSKVIKCDRCGAVFSDRNHARTMPSGTKYIAGQLSIRNRNGFTVELFDLCDDCFAKLFEFIEGERKEEAEAEHGEEAEG